MEKRALLIPASPRSSRDHTPGLRALPPFDGVQNTHELCFLVNIQGERRPRLLC